MGWDCEISTDWDLGCPISGFWSSSDALRPLTRQEQIQSSLITIAHSRPYGPLRRLRALVELLLMAPGALLVLLPPWLLAALFVVTALTCVVASLSSVRRLVLLEPAIVFKA